MKVTQDLVKEYFTYSNGYLFWNKHRRQNRIGTKVGRMCRKQNGVYYLRVDFKNKTWGVHRLIFLYENGYLPEIVDHEDGDTLNNKSNNLRDATKSQNAANRKVKPGSSSKYLGVWKRKNKYKEVWCVNMTHHGQRIKVGTFSTELEAAHAYNIKASELHGEFARLNKI